MRNKAVLFFIFLSSCASRPLFQKLEAGTGYELREGSSPEILEISATLPSSSGDSFLEAYLLRAAGEECLKRSFSYFAHARLTDTSQTVVCFAKPERRSIGIVLDPKMGARKPPILRVIDTRMGSHSPLRPYDLIKRLGGRPVSSLGEFLEREAVLAKEGKTSATVHVERSDIPLNLEASFFETGEGILGPDRLELLRKEVP